MNHSEAATKFNLDEQKVNWHDKALWFVRHKRDTAVHKVKGWEELRSLASQIKANVLSNLDEYLIQFEKSALSNGVQVHWASDADEHNEIVLNILNIEALIESKKAMNRPHDQQTIIELKALNEKKKS